jgi:DNA-binding MarR family transcriptional regulator
MSNVAPIDQDIPLASLRLWLRLYRSVSMIEREVRSRFTREFGVSLSRFDVMSALDRHPGGLSMGELSDGLLVSNGNVTGLISRLVDDRLVDREHAPGDRRSYRVKLTPDGRDSFAEMAAAHARWLGEILVDLPDSEADDLTAHIDSLMKFARLDASKD